jgi:hypothetical protein
LEIAKAVATCVLSLVIDAAQYEMWVIAKWRSCSRTTILNWSRLMVAPKSVVEKDQYVPGANISVSHHRICWFMNATNAGRSPRRAGASHPGWKQARSSPQDPYARTIRSRRTCRCSSVQVDSDRTCKAGCHIERSAFDGATAFRPKPSSECCPAA